MLKTNSKKARENLKNYIMHYTEDIASDYGYDENFLKDYNNRCFVIFKIFMIEKRSEFDLYNNKINGFEVFKSWASGLALNDLFCYWYNRPAKKDLHIILEQTEKEQEKYTENQAEVFLTKLIYDAVIRGYNKFMSKTK